MIPLLLAAAQAAATLVAVPPQPQLTEEIRAADAALFALYFARADHCAVIRTC